MAAGWLQGKKFSAVQVGSVVILTLGVLVSAFADAGSKVSPFISLGCLALLCSTRRCFV